jgi:hypothetical protein
MTNVVDSVVTDRYGIYNGDCVDVLRGLPDASVGYSIFSPPFSSLYTYSNSPRDIGNARSYAEFFEHFAFVVSELYRVLKPGRLVSVHCMDLPTSKERDGYIGIRDFRGDLVRAFTSAGFYLHSQVTIWKDPVTAMQRTKSIGLLHKQLKKDSALSRQGIPDYLVTLRKPGDNDEPLAHTAEDFPVALWQRYASPVWASFAGEDEEGFLKCHAEETDDSSGINPSNTLQYRSAREHDDERHICPLQLSVIRRALKLWSNPGDTVISPFAGIGSEGYCALEMGRRFIGAELKSSYYRQALANLESVVAKESQQTLFGGE